MYNNIKFALMCFLTFGIMKYILVVPKTAIIGYYILLTVCILDWLISLNISKPVETKKENGNGNSNRRV